MLDSLVRRAVVIEPKYRANGTTVDPAWNAGEVSGGKGILVSGQGAAL
jgi:hypothetical protein